MQELIANFIQQPITNYEQHTYLIAIYIIAGLIGLVVGSFLNVVIYRVPNNMSVAFPPSHCPKCNYKLKWYDNIPVLSYLILGGKCRCCKEKISIRYTIVEILNAALWLLCVFCLLDGKGDCLLPYNAYLIRPHLVYTVLCMIACSVFLCIAFIDLEHMFIPDRFQVILAVLGVIAIVASLLGFKDGIEWYERLIGAGGSLVLFLIIYFAGMLVFKREATGIGDIKLVTAAGLLLGWKNMVLGIFLGYLVGAIVLVIAKRLRQDEEYTEYPFGPFLVFGMLVAMLFGNQIIGAYLSLI